MFLHRQKALSGTRPCNSLSLSCCHSSLPCLCSDPVTAVRAPDGLSCRSHAALAVVLVGLGFMFTHCTSFKGPASTLKTVAISSHYASATCTSISTGLQRINGHTVSRLPAIRSPLTIGLHNYQSGHFPHKSLQQLTVTDSFLASSNYLSLTILNDSLI